MAPPIPYTDIRRRKHHGQSIWQQVAYKSSRFTYADYCTWPEEGRWELIDGEPYAMSPAPARFIRTWWWRWSSRYTERSRGRPAGST